MAISLKYSTCFVAYQTLKLKTDKTSWDDILKVIRKYQCDRQKSLNQKRDKTMANKKETKDKHSMHNTILKTRAGVTRTLQHQDEFRCF